MSDTKILITDRNGELLNHDIDYSSYNFQSDVFSIADAFTLELAAIDKDIKNWYEVQLIINNSISFKGIIQKISKSGSKSTKNITLSGKDRGSILVESYCTSFKDFVNKSPKYIAEKLVNQTNFYAGQYESTDAITEESDWNNSEDVKAFNDAIKIDRENNKAYTTRKNRNEYDQSFTSLPNKAQFKIEPGDMVFDKLNDLTQSIGTEMMYLNSGVLYFGDLEKRRNDQSIFEINLTEDDQNNNVLSYSADKDDSGRYSTITVVSQDQYDNVRSSTVTDSTVLDKRSMTVSINDDSVSVKKEAIKIREDQRIESVTATYEVNDFEQNGKVWEINSRVKINDTINNIIGTFVIYSRTFSFTKGGDKKTTISISYPRRKGVNV